MKIIRLFLLTLILLSLGMSITPASGDSGIIGVWIPVEENHNINRINNETGLLIDYGSFLWMTSTEAELTDLDRAGVDYQVIETPYVLTLGGKSFDPLLSTPDFQPARENQSSETNPGLRLVQFQGPIKDEWMNNLKSNGLDVLQYIHPFTYVVWGDSVQLDAARSHAFVRWTGDFLPPYAVHPMYRTLNSTPIQVRAMVYAGIDLTEINQAVESLGGNQLSSTSDPDPGFSLLSFTLPGDKLQAFASLPGVYAVQPVPTDGGDRGEMSNQINAGNYNRNNRAYTGYLNWLTRLRLSGEGVIIANVDSGIDQNHTDLRNRILTCSGSTCGGAAAGNHGTHTAGIMAGDASSGARDAFGFLRGLGMAPGANLIEQIYSPTYTEEGGMLTLMSQSSQNGAVISGNSWGPSGSPLGYDLDTRLVDIGVRDADPLKPGNQSLTYVLSIMNGYGGISTQGTPDEAKNSFTIGSTLMQYYDGSQNLWINNLSPNTAHGPALDGRQIPHLVAPGYAVDSTVLGNSYTLMGGTSMASPHVSGAAALFFERYRKLYGEDPSPALVKAAFLPVAHDLAGNTDADGGLLGHPFDSKQGWGRLNAADVLNPSGRVFYYDQPVILSNTGETWKVNIQADEPLEYLRAMLVWTDAAGHGLGGSTPAWVNNLDLTLSFDGRIYRGNHFGANGLSIPGSTPDGKNNTEGIFLSASPAGTYTFKITAANIAGDGVPNFGDQTDQDFALVIYMSYNPLSYQYIFPIFFR